MNEPISFCFNPINRNTNAFTLGLRGHVFFISYNTIIGYAGSFGNCRLNNRWGPTTGRHMKELGISSYRVVSEQEMLEVQKRVIAEVGIHYAQEPFQKKLPRD